MMLRVNDSYINLPDPPVIVRQTKTPDALDSAGDFSYSFTLPATNEVKRILGVADLTSFEIACDILSDQGIRVHTGTLSVDTVSQTGIECSFLSGNSEWFVMLDNLLVSDIPLNFVKDIRQPLLNVVTPNPLLVASWANTSGIVFPLIDAGRIKDVIASRLESPDFMPFVYVRDLLKRIFISHGIKLSGELFDDGFFNTIIIGGTLQRDESLPFFEWVQVFANNDTPQAISTTPVKLSFPDTSFPYYNGTTDPWVTDKYLTPIDFDGKIFLDLTFDSSVDYVVELRKGGSTVGTLTGTGSLLKQYFLDNSFLGSGKDYVANIDEGVPMEIWLYITSGSTNVIGNIKFEPVRLSHYYPHFLVGDLSQTDFVKSVFTMFNVVPIYDNITKTLTCNLFENISEKEPIDLSEYVSSYEMRPSEIKSELAQKIILKHQQDSTDDIELFNRLNFLEWGSGDIDVNANLIDPTREIETNFIAPFSYYNDRFLTNLISIGVYEYSDSDDGIEISSVTDDSGVAVFNTSEEHGLKQLDYLRIRTNGGIYDGLGLVNSVPTDTSFKIQYVSFISNATGLVYNSSLSINNSTGPYIASYYPNISVSDISNQDTINYAGTQYSSIAWAYFLKQPIGKESDKLRYSPAFEDSLKVFNIGLIDQYYGLYSRAVFEPNKCVLNMIMPEKVYLSIDPSRPIIINTADFSFRFFMMKDTGYINSSTEFEVELMKL